MLLSLLTDSFDFVATPLIDASPDEFEIIHDLD
jgi:hypothetical protein